ncbi:MAG: hypothetical protein ACRCY5_03360 [Phocaeicola sp.]
MNGLYKLVCSQMTDLSPISGDAFTFFGKKLQSVKSSTRAFDYTTIFIKLKSIKKFDRGDDA